MTAHLQAAHHDGIDAGCGPLSSFALDADGAGPREELDGISTNVVDCLTNITKQGITLTVSAL